MAVKNAKSPNDSNNQKTSQKKPNADSDFSFDTSIITDQLKFVRNLAGTTSEVVQKAASILEEEIAAGIVAAKKVEEQFINVKAVREANPGDIIPRFRKDAHEIVDLLVDLVNVAVQSLDKLSQQLITVGGAEASSSPKSKANTAGAMPKVHPNKPVKAGTTVEIPMTLQNESDSPTEMFEFFSTDLVSGNGNRIAAGNITFSPATLTIAPHETAKVLITVKLPKNCKPGDYSGLIQANKLNQLHAVLALTVE
jgi:hypothetical protein